MAGEIRGPRSPIIKPSAETSSTSEVKSSKQSSQTSSTKTSKTQLDDTASQKRASKDLAAGTKMDTQLRSTSQKMDLLKELSSDQKRQLEEAKKKSSQSTDLSSLPTYKTGTEHGTIRREKGDVAKPACTTGLLSTCGKTDTPSMGCPEKTAGSLRDKTNAGTPACTTGLLSTCGKTDTPSMGCPEKSAGSLREKTNAAKPACTTGLLSTCGKTDTPSMGCPDDRTVGRRTEHDTDHKKTEHTQDPKRQRHDHHREAPRTQRRRH